MTDLDGTNVLLVEDDSIIALAEKKMLQRHGLRVTTAANGPGAISLCHEQTFDLVLMDIDLGPGVDGTQTAETILAERSFPIVFLSSHTEPDIVERTERVATYGYVVKNSGEHVLVASIKMALRLHEAREAARQHERDSTRWQQVLEERNERLQDLADTVPGIVYQLVTLPDGSIRYTYMSKGCETYYGVSAEEVYENPDSIFSTIPEEDQRRIASLMDESASEMIPGHIAHRVDGPGGVTRWMHAYSTPRPDENGEITWNGISVDITEQKEAERALEAERESFRLIGETIPALVYVYDIREQRNVWSNRYHAEFFAGSSGTPDSTFAFDDVQRLAHRDDFTRVAELTEELVRTGSELGFQTELRVAKGDAWRTLLLTITPFKRDHQGQILQVIGSAMDISDRKRTEEELARTSEELAQRDRSRKLLLREMNHRVKNSLLLAASLISLQDEWDADQVARLQDRIRTIATVHELLESTSNTASVDLQLYLPEAVRKVASSVAPESATVECRADSLVVDSNIATSLGLITNELVSNAVKHGIGPGAEGDITVLFSVGEEICTLSVANTPSIAASQRPNKPTGMGIDLVRSLCEQYGGRILREDRDNTVFVVELPRKKIEHEPGLLEVAP